MKLTQLTAKNFKQQSFTDDLAGVTLYTGANSRGKSARLEALWLARLGYVPGYSSKGSDIFNLFATGNPMSVVASNGTSTVARQWREERGSVKYTGPDGAEGEAAHLDPAAYFNLSGPERTKFLFAASGAAKALDKGRLAATLAANVKNIKLEENTPQSEVVIRETVEWLDARTKIGMLGVQEWLEELVESAKEKFKLAKQNVQRLEKTQQGNVQANSAVPPAPQDAEAKLAAAREELRAAEQEATRAQAETDQVRKEWREADALARTAVDETVARARMAELDAERARLFVLHAEQASDAELKARCTALREENMQAFADESWAVKQIDRVNAEIEHAESETTCPACGQSTVEVKKKVVAALKKELKAAHGKLADASDKQKTVKVGLAKAQEELDQLQAANAAAANNDADYRRCAEEHAAIQAKLAGGEKAAEAAKKLPELVERGKVLADKLGWADGAVAAKRAMVSVSDVQAKQLLAERADAAQRARVGEELDKARAEQQVLNGFVGKKDSILATLQADLVEKAVGPLVAKMNELCRPILPGFVSFQDGELVMCNAERNWSHKTASDSEKLLIYAALSVALASESPLKIAAIGRLESFDGKKKPRLVRLLLDLVKAGKLDQAVLVEVDAGGADWTAQFAGEDFKRIVL